MKTVTIITAIVLLCLGGVVWVQRQTRKRPQLMQSPQNQPEQQPETTTSPKGAPLPFPLTVPQGFTIALFAQNLSGVRDLAFSPNGTLLASLPGQGRIVALPDENHDGIADSAVTAIDGLNHPHGIAFYNRKLFIISVNNVSRYSFDEPTKKATKEKDLFSLPGGGGHTNYTITFGADGQMFVALGSTCNVCIEQNPWRATVLVSDENGNNPRVFATGLRNAAFITFDATENKLWATEMGRDWLGDNLPPDEINIIEQGNDYGWPYCYGNRVVDSNFNARTTQEQCDQTIAPIYQIQAHSAPLGLAFVPKNYPENTWQGDLLVAYHGSWNRSVPTGYNVVKLNREGDTLTGQEDIITGFLSAGQKKGRPVDLTFDANGNLYISDDYSGNIYIFSPSLS